MDVKTMMGLTGFPKELFTPDKLEFQKDANMLKRWSGICRLYHHSQRHLCAGDSDTVLWRRTGRTALRTSF